MCVHVCGRKKIEPAEGVYHTSKEGKRKRKRARKRERERERKEWKRCEREEGRRKAKATERKVEA